MTDELNPEVLDVDQLVNATTKESSEETETKPESEEVVKDSSLIKPEETPDAETIALIKSIREEVGDKRFNGLMSSWQKDRGELKKYQEKEKVSTTTSQDGQDDALIEYLDKKLEAKRSAREQVLQEQAQKEVDETRTIYPQYSEEQLFKTANKLSIPGRPASLMTAAIHLSELDNAINSKGQLTAEEILKKNKAATIAGRSGVQVSTGVRKYDPDKDKNKSINELVEDAFSEEGLK